MKELIEGYRKFISSVYPSQKSRFKKLADRQNPHTLFITCADSRVVPSMIFQAEPGDLFLCRVVGNLVPTHGAAVGGVSSAIEYAVMVLGVRHIVICGHSDCGAMRAFLHPEKLASLKAVESWLHHAEGAIAMTKELHAGEGDEVFVNSLIRENVVSQLQNLKTHPCVASKLRTGKLEIYGLVYDIETGEVIRYDEDARRFVPLAAAVEKGAPEAVAHT